MMVTHKVHRADDEGVVPVALAEVDERQRVEVGLEVRVKGFEDRDVLQPID